jgi:hypothetical protein
MPVDLTPAKNLTARLERIWLKRWFKEPRMKATRLEVRLDLSTASDQVRADADLWFRPQVASATMVCLIGSAKVHSAIWKRSTPIKVRVNDPYLVLTFPQRLDTFVETQVTLKYTYRPDEHWTIQQPITATDFAEKVTITCRRPLLGIVQGKLLSGTESPPFRTYTWEAPRAKKLNAFAASVQSFRKQAPSGVNMWLHCQAASVDLAPRILDLCVQIYEECADSHHRKLPFADYHVVECDVAGLKPFNSPGMIVVPRGTFATDDRPTVYGVLAPEFNKEWRRDVTRMVADGKKD